MTTYKKVGRQRMSDAKKYPTRMHEVLGVETGQVFYFETTSGLYQEYVLDAKGHLFRNHKTQRIESPRTMADIINNPDRIIRKPRLSEEQVKQLKALHKAFGVRYAHNPENADCMVLFSIKPLTVEERMEWDGSVVVNDCAAGAGLRKLFTQKGQVVDIVQALRDAGVEVDDG